jgi:hypothetical protein
MPCVLVLVESNAIASNPPQAQTLQSRLWRLELRRNYAESSMSPRRNHTTRSADRALGQRAVKRSFSRIVAAALMVLGLGCGGSATGANNGDAGDGSGAACPQKLPQSCPAQPPSYASDIAPLIAARCLQCHGPGGVAYPSRDFTSYDKVYAQRRNMLGMIYACKMPPPGATPLAAQELQDLLAWFVCNAPNN